MAAKKGNPENLNGRGNRPDRDLRQEAEQRALETGADQKKSFSTQ